MATRKPTSRKKTTGSQKKKTPLQNARSRYAKAKADLKAGKVGASKRLDKAVSDISRLSCKAKK